MIFNKWKYIAEAHTKNLVIEWYDFGQVNLPKFKVFTQWKVKEQFQPWLVKINTLSIIQTLFSIE